MTYLPPESALHRLKHGELCIVALQDGTQRETEWHKHNEWFSFTEPPAGTVKPDEVYEWWPAGVGF